MPDKTQYRLFKIKDAPANNDLEALKEMLERRLKHAEWPYPDLILIDGGRPQIEYLSTTMAPFQAKTAWLGLSKLNGDHLVFPAKAKNVFKDLAQTIKRTLQQVRDEAHRFANRGRSRRYFKDNLKRG
jgi:excinuclease ABC subunit C